jgi:hypothetical protein
LGGKIRFLGGEKETWRWEKKSSKLSTLNCPSNKFIGLKINFIIRPVYKPVWMAWICVYE